MPPLRYCTGCSNAFPAETLHRGLCSRCSQAKDAERLEAEPWRVIYTTRRWRLTRAAARRRAGDRCEARTDGMRCLSRIDLEAHHLIPLRDGGEPFDLDNVVVLCPRHHALAERAVRA